MKESTAQDSASKAQAKHIENDYVRFETLSALVIDDISAMRHAIRSQLQSLGMNNVSVTSNAEDALRMIESINFDLILCDYNLNKSSSGQHFLEHLRTERILSATTIFVMLTAETEYSYVASAVEFLPDDYLVKPCSEAKLRSRLVRLIDRRSFLMPVLKAINAKQYELALKLCDKLLTIAPDDRRRMDVLRHKAEVHSILHDYPAMQQTFTQAAAIRDDVPWVLLGLARTCHALGEIEPAGEIAQTLIEQNPHYVAAYELLAKVRLETDQEEEAYELLTRSALILPSAKRHRAVSQAAYLLGKLAEAKMSTEAAIRLSSGSMVERSGDFLSLAQIQVDLGELKEALDTLERRGKKYGNVGLFGVAKDAIRAQAYFDSGEKAKAKKLIEHATSLLAARKNGFIINVLGKSSLKAGDVMQGLKLLTRAIQVSGRDELRIARHVKRSMMDTGHQDKIEQVIDGGRKRILSLIDECSKLMRTAQFEAAYQKVLEALEIQDENIEALLTAAQLHLLWLKHSGRDAAVMARARSYLAALDKLVPNHPKVMNFYRFFNEIVSQ